MIERDVKVFRIFFRISLNFTLKFQFFFQRTIKPLQKYDRWIYKLRFFGKIRLNENKHNDEPGIHCEINF